MAKILIVEDAQEINDMLKEYLESDGYQCIQAFSGTEAQLLLSNQSFDLVLLDLMLPGTTGETILSEITKQEKIPVIVISAKEELETRIQILELGADDYICKPFELKEVLARVHVQLRKFERSNTPTIIKLKNLTLDLNAFQLFINNKEINLTKHEFLILELLMKSPNQVFTKQAIYEYVWGETYFGDERTINTHISNLRVKFRKVNKEEYIQTIWGIGFKFKNE